MKQRQMQGRGTGQTGTNLLEMLRELRLFSLEKMEWRLNQYMQISGQVAREWGQAFFSGAH